MSFAIKTDYVGLGTLNTNLKLKSNSQNATNQTLEIPRSDGSIYTDEVFGYVSNPTCEYVIAGNTSLTAMALGNVYSEEGKYALQSLTITTGAGQEPTVQATATQIENGSNKTVCTYNIQSVPTLTPARHAITFNAFDYAESMSCTLQSTTYTAAADISPATVNGVPVASDATAGKETLQITMWSTSEEEAPAISVSGQWHVTQCWTCTGADSQMYSWTCTLTNYLSAQYNA